MTNKVTSIDQIDKNDDDVRELSQEPIVPQQPLQQIALCMSGGGFRAASFSLGVLSYFKRIKYHDSPLLDFIRFTTSTSGGSITNAAFSISAYRKEKFEDMYSHLRLQMTGELLISTAIKILENKKQWTEQGILREKNKPDTTIYKERNIINAFAKSYDQLLYTNATLGTIANTYKGKPSDRPPLEEVAFNTTEFNNGLAFYFQANGEKNWVSFQGNGYLSFNNIPLASKLKISDIVAASSCFPGGFEPMRYPTDFVYEDNTDVTAMLDGINWGNNDPLNLPENEKKPFALMDGGIVDNMGLNCVLKKDRSRVNFGKAPFDLIMSCDVTSYFVDPLKQTPKRSKSWFSRITIQQVCSIFKFANLIFLFSLFSILRPWYPVTGWLLLVTSSIMSIVYWVGFFKLRKMKSNENGIAAMALKYLDYFFKLRFSDFIPLLTVRLTSVSDLVGNLFLKQIRRLQYSELFTTPAMKDRAIACLVYEFSTVFQPKRLENLAKRDAAWWPSMSNILMPSEPLQKLVDSAWTMGTTLWFTEGDQEKKDQLIANGQLTACYSLIKHICRLEVLDVKHKNNPDLQDLKKRLLVDWEHFKSDPKFMLNDIHIKS